MTTSQELHDRIVGQNVPKRFLANVARNGATTVLQWKNSSGEWDSWTLDELAVCDTVIPTLPVPAGETVRIDLRVSMADVDGLTAQDESANLAFEVDVRDAQNPFSAEPCELTGGGGELPGTGTEPFPMVALSAGLLLSGLLLLLMRRRAGSEES